MYSKCHKSFVSQELSAKIVHGDKCYYALIIHYSFIKDHIMIELFLFSLLFPLKKCLRPLIVHYFPLSC